MLPFGSYASLRARVSLGLFLVELALAERDSKNAGVFFFRVSSRNGRPWSQAFLAETLETGIKNRDDFHCMQLSLVMSMRFIFGDDWNDAPCSVVPVYTYGKA